jgi:short-subunit dehydrogenase
VTQPVALITGASSGIGAATTRLLSREGFHVILAARRIERLEQQAEEIRAEGGSAIAVQTDLAELPQIKNLVESALERFGQIDILINNAGMGRLKWLDELDLLQDIAYQIAVNLSGTIHLTRLILPHMLERGQGQIIYVSSVAAWIAPPTYSIYAATKYGMKGFAESLHREVRERGIHVGTVYPGPVATEFDQHAGVSWETEATTPPWMLLEAEDVARAIYRMVQRKKRRIIIPGVLKIAVWGNALFPGLVDWVFSKFFNRQGEVSITWGQRQ